MTIKQFFNMFGWKVGEPLWVGGKYYLDQKLDNPFSTSPALEVEILEIKKGWVRYRFLPICSMFQNEAMRESMFMSMYLPVRNARLPQVDGTDQNAKRGTAE